MHLPLVVNGGVRLLVGQLVVGDVGVIARFPLARGGGAAHVGGAAAEDVEETLLGQGGVAVVVHPLEGEGQLVAARRQLHRHRLGGTVAALHREGGGGEAQALQLPADLVVRQLHPILQPPAQIGVLGQGVVDSRGLDAVCGEVGDGGVVPRDHVKGRSRDKAAGQLLPVKDEAVVGHDDRGHVGAGDGEHLVVRRGVAGRVHRPELVGAQGIAVV